MKINDNLSESLPQIQVHIFEFYKSLFEQVGEKNASM
jgi:hypothetical protein